MKSRDRISRQLIQSHFTEKNHSIDSSFAFYHDIVMFDKRKIVGKFALSEQIVVYPGDCLSLLKDIPDGSIKLVVTSPPYNIGKEYEKRRKLEIYLKQQEAVIRECVRCLSPNGSICWQVGNFVGNGAIIPLDTVLYPIFIGFGLKMRNRIVWHFEHGLHCSRRFSGRYETIVWFTKSNDYTFHLDPVRVPQKYPGKKYFKGPNIGKYSSNPLGKNPGDLWVIPNVKSNHVEKTEHPCQFPVELIERLVLSMTDEDDWVLDPFLGTGTSIIAAIRHNRRAVGVEIVPEYIELARDRIRQELAGTLRTRPMNKPVYDPINARNSLAQAPWAKNKNPRQLLLIGDKKIKHDRE
jgi:adenine-specific DNA-methyltransferase